MRLAFLFLILFSAGVSAAGAQEPATQTLTLPQALQMLHTRSPVLLGGRAHMEAIQANQITATLRPNPLFTSTNEDFNVFHPSRFDIANKQEFVDGVLYTVERGGKRSLRGESAKWSTSVARDQFRDTERQLEFAVKGAFVVMLLAKSNLQLAEDNLRDYRERVRLNEIRLKAGEISPTELDRIRVEQARFENDVLNARLARDQARVQLENLLGLEDFPASLDVQGELVAPEILLSQGELLAKALAARPDYLAAQDSQRKSEADVRLADANGATDIAFGGEYKRNGPDNTLGFTVQFPLRVFDRNQGEKLRTRRELDSSRMAELAARIAVNADVAQAFAAYRTALTRARLYSGDYLQRARQLRDRVAFSYRNGGASLLDYLDALRSHRDVELAYRSSYAQVMNAIHQLSFVTGTELWP